jgi:predicted dehydrogenase
LRDFRIGIIGCGRISQAYVDAIDRCEAVELSAVMDTRADAARTVAEATGASAHTTVESFCAEAGVDGAIICAPPVFHKEIAVALMQAGIPALCEKPFATCHADAYAMVEAAQAANLVLMMASKFRYVEDVIRAKAIIASGMLGDVHFYENAFWGMVDMRRRWNSDPKIGGGGVLIDNGTHSVDVVRYLLGPIRRVFAHSSQSEPGLGVEDTVNLCFITDSDVMGTIRLSWNLQADRNSYVELCGTDGALRVDWQESAYQNHGHPQWVSFGVGYDKVAAFVNQVENFAGTVRGTAEPLISLADGVSSVLAVEAAYRSMETGNWVDVEEQRVAPAAAVAVGK